MTLIPAKDHINGRFPNFLYVSDELYDLMTTYGIKLLVKSINEDTYSETCIEPKTLNQVVDYMVLYEDYTRTGAIQRLGEFDIKKKYFSIFNIEFQEEYYFTCKDNDMLMLFKLAL